MGCVYCGRDLSFQRDLAVKVLLEAHQGKPSFVRRFLREAHVLGQLEQKGYLCEEEDSLPPGEAAPLPFPSPKPLTVEPRARARRRTSQPELLLAMPTAGIEDADEPAMELLSQILGGFQERLSTEIREKRGWAYWIGLVEWRFPGMGLFGVRTAVPKKRLGVAVAGQDRGGAEEADRPVQVHLHGHIRRAQERGLQRGRGRVQSKLAFLLGRSMAFVATFSEQRLHLEDVIHRRGAS